MRRRKALGVVFAYEGPQPTSEASDKKLTSGTGREKDTPSRSWTTRVHQRRNSRQRGNQETWNWSSRKFQWSLRPRIRCQRGAGGDGVGRNSSSSRRRLLTRLEEVEPKKAKTESPRLDILVTSSEEARMSQSSILVEDGGNGSHNPHEDLVRGCETEAEDPELVRPLSHHEAKITTRIVMRGTCR